MPKAIWALDFGGGSLKAVRGGFDKRTGRIVVDTMEEIDYGELPCGYEASAVDRQREAVIEFRSRHTIGSGDILCVSVTGSEVFSRFINLPPVPESIDEIIRYEARQQIPFDLDEVIWDYQPVKEEHEIGEEIEVGLFALKKARVNQLLDALSPWRKNLRVVQAAPLAVFNLLEHEGMVEEPSVVLDVGASTTDVLVLNPPRFWVRSLLVAGNDMTNALVEKFGVAVEEAEQIKRRLARSTHRDQIVNILNPVFDEIGNEIQRSLGYYKSLARDVRFSRVLLLGGALRMSGMRDMLAKRLQYRVQALGEMQRIELAPSVASERAQAMLPGFAAALGLLVQGAGRSRVSINLVPEEIQLENVMARKRAWLVGAAVGLLVAVGLLIAGERLHAQEIRGVDRDVDWDEVSKCQTDEATWQALHSQVEALAQSDLAGFVGSDVDPNFVADILTVVANELPGDVSINSLSLNWLEPENIAQVFEAGRRGGIERGASGREMEEARPEWYDEYIMSEEGEGLGDEGGAGLVPGGSMRAGFASDVLHPMSSMRSKLVVGFAGESRVISKQYIQEQVVGALKAAVLPGRATPAFERAELVGELRDVWRSATTGEIVRGLESTALVEHFVSFTVYGVVDLGGAEQEEEVSRGRGRP